MSDLIDYIDELIHDCIGDGEFHGLCRLLQDDQGEVYPATYPDSAGKFIKVTPNDRHTVVTYHRLLDGAFEDSETFSFGRTMSVENKQLVRMVVLVHFDEGESVIDNIINALPDQMTPSDIGNADYKSVIVGPAITLIRDRDSIWTTEWGNAYKDKYQMRYNIYAIEYTISYIKCPSCVTS